MKKYFFLIGALITISNVIIASEFAEQDPLTPAQRLTTIETQVTSLGALLNVNPALGDLTLTAAKTAFTENAEITLILRAITTRGESSKLSDILQSKKEAYKLLQNVIKTAQLETARSWDDATLFALDFLQAKNAMYHEIAKARLGFSNWILFVNQQNTLSLNLPYTQFAVDPRVEWLITAHQRSFDSDVKNNFTVLKDLINNDGIRHLGYVDIGSLEKELFGSKGEAQVEQVVHKVEHEAARIGKQVESLGKKIGKKFRF